MICIVGKIAIVALMLMIAIKMYHTKYKRCTMIPLILIIYIVGVSAVN